MAELFARGRIIDLILALVALEAILLIAFQPRRIRGPTRVDLMTMLLPGVFLMLALRGALVEAHWTWIAGCLLLSLISHLTDLWRRCRA